MNESRVNRLPQWAGIAGAVLLAAGFVFVGVDASTQGDSRADVLATYSDDGTNARQALGMLFTALGAVALLPFISDLRLRVGRIAGETSPLPGAVFAGGVILVSAAFVGAAMGSAVSAGTYFDAYRVDPDVAMTGAATGFYVNGFAGMAGGLLIGGTALACRRARLLPGWLTVTGLVVAVASVPAGLLGMWILVEAAWLALAAGVLARRPGEVVERSETVAGMVA